MSNKENLDRLFELLGVFTGVSGLCVNVDEILLLASAYRCDVDSKCQRSIIDQIKLLGVRICK